MKKAASLSMRPSYLTRLVLTQPAIAGLFPCLEVGSGALSRLFLDRRLILGFWLWTATRPLGQRSLDFLDRFGLGNPLHRSDLARQSVERGLIQLALGIRLFRLRLRTIEIANDLGDCDD